MGYSGYKATPPRSALVILGGMIAWAGLVTGVLITTPEYHRALTTADEPTEMTWQELVDNGLDGNRYVRLVDVQMDHSNPVGMIEDMFKQFDPEAPIGDQQQAFELAAENMNFAEVAAAAMQPAKVYPKGSDPNDVPMKIVVPQTACAMDAAFEEIEESGTLTGRFEVTQFDGFEMQLAQVMLAGAAAQIEQAQEAAVGGEDAEDAAEDPLRAAQQDPPEAAQAAVVHDDGLRFVYQPMHQVLDRTEAAQWFWLSGLAVAVGLVICGSGGPSLVCCVFFQGPSVLSILGYPMRYGRAGTTTRLLYAGVGLGLLYYGYQKMILEGQFGQVDGDLGLAAMGFIAGSIGAAALLGSITNVVAERLNVSLEPSTAKKVPERKMSFTEACSLEPVEASEATHYVDPQLLSDYSAELPQSMKAIAESLATVGFSDPEPVVWAEDEQSRPALIQLGCKEMVVVDIEEIEGRLVSRLVSVLHDGMAVVTLSRNASMQSALRFGTSGVYRTSDSDDPMEMLSTHLEQTVSMAEKRDTAVVSIESTEATDVALFARRVLADIQAQYGEQNTEVDPYQYGRFQLPVAPIAQLSGV